MAKGLIFQSVIDICFFGNKCTCPSGVPTPRGVSNPTPLLLCPKGIIPRVGQTGISITLILGQCFFSPNGVVWG